MDYYSIPAISNSSLAYIDPAQGGCPLKMKDYLDGKMPVEKKRFYEVGDALHKALLEPETLIVADFNKPSETIEKIIDTLYNRLYVQGITPVLLSDYEEDILKIINEEGYQTNWKDETRIKKVIEQGEEYFNFLLSTDGKIALDAKSKEILDKCTYSILTNPETNALIQGFEGYDMLTEYEIFWSYKVDNPEHVFQCKSKLDRVYINHKTKTFHIIDLKSTSKTLHQYPNFFEEYKYYRQLAFYEAALLSDLESKGKSGYVPGTHYQIVVEKFGYFNSAPFAISRSFIEVGIKEIEKLFIILSHHKQAGNWIYPMDIEGNIKRVINLFPSENMF